MRVSEAQARQAARFGQGQRFNTDLASRALRRHFALDKQGTHLLTSAVRRLPLSARGYDRVLKVRGRSPTSRAAIRSMR